MSDLSNETLRRWKLEASGWSADDYLWVNRFLQVAARLAALEAEVKKIRDEFPDKSLRGRGDYWAENLHRARDIAREALGGDQG